jgi:hypothetical protein
MTDDQLILSLDQFYKLYIIPIRLKDGYFHLSFFLSNQSNLLKDFYLLSCNNIFEVLFFEGLNILIEFQFHRHYKCI